MLDFKTLFSPVLTHHFWKKQLTHIHTSHQLFYFGKTLQISVTVSCRGLHSGRKRKGEGGVKLLYSG